MVEISLAATNDFLFFFFIIIIIIIIFYAYASSHSPETCNISESVALNCP